jgi:sulfatase modifying factor 1
MQIDPSHLARAGEGRDDNGLGMKFSWCPPGTFQMGDAPGIRRRLSDADLVMVKLSRGFWMGRFEVTQAQWLRFMGATLREQRAKDPTQPRPVGDGSTRDHVGEGPDHPIYFVNHTESEEFCRKLTEEERRSGRLPSGWEYRLPTEAQWEFACRAGSTTATAFGDQMDSTAANFDGTTPFNGAPVGPYLRETTPVGRYRANAWGLHDMHGNVWEWCSDSYAEKLAGGIDPLGATSAARRAYRGGCWHNPGALCLSASRGWGKPDDRGSGLGFRVALVATGP